MRLLCLLSILLAACGGAEGSEDVAASTDTMPTEVGVDAVDLVVPQDAPADTPADTPLAPPSFRAVTFNTGTSLKPPLEGAKRGYGREQWDICDEWYGNGLSWKPIMEDTKAFLADVDADVIVFQEVFDPEECAEIPQEFHPGFVCEDWQPGDPAVAQLILTGDWQVMCNPVRTDKCAAVKLSFGSFIGCEEAYCREGMFGSKIDGCGKGVRIGRAEIALTEGGVLTLVNVHGSSGMTEEDMACRVKQFDQVFVDLGDGEPAANGEWNLILGDWNTDPGRMADADPSAARILDFAGPDKDFHFITEVGLDAPATYGGFINIDHVISDVFDGTCWHAGITEGHPPPTEAVSFDHHPAVCDLAGVER